MYGVQKAFRTSAERLMYVQLTSFVQVELTGEDNSALTPHITSYKALRLTIIHILAIYLVERTMLQMRLKNMYRLNVTFSKHK